MDLLHTHTQCQDVFINMEHHDLDIQMTLIVNIVL